MKNEYSIDNIKSLSACEAVRLRPNLYFEKCFKEQNLDALPLEIACHAIDEVFDNNCTFIEFIIFDNHFSIKYNAGMSLAKSHDKYRAELIMTSAYACRNEKKHISVGEEFCELGIATINFASEYCHLTTVSQDTKGIFQFEKGQIISSNVHPIDNETDYTEIVLKPDQSIFKGLKFNFNGIKLRADQLRESLKRVEISLINHQTTGT